eukprot:TRINITY_DN30929_c0_g1_i2.p3 TRINITY_DN30929_c0_g1~~TRINITY_DN30929_c0_g1_i2.p3  ORF type:complete len:126 (-),score=5.16 TRINITY_DN30929_c0_g1_i2:36-413(-)
MDALESGGLGLGWGGHLIFLFVAFRGVSEEGGRSGRGAGARASRHELDHHLPVPLPHAVLVSASATVAHTYDAANPSAFTDPSLVKRTTTGPDTRTASRELRSPDSWKVRTHLLPPSVGAVYSET